MPFICKYNIILFDDTEETLAEDAAQESTEEANMESSEENIEDDAIPADDMDNLPEELPEDFYTVFPTGGVIDEEPLVDIESVSDGQKRLFRSGLLPEEYVTPELPPLRKQSPYGTCWAFATTALVEINLMKNGFMSDPDMSELHLAYFTYNTETDPLGGTEGDVIKK